MSDFKVEILRVTIIPHPNADSLELALVGPVETAFHCVTQKGKFTTGDLVAYIPAGAILPENLIADMGLQGCLKGSAKNRVGSIKLRGEVSTGLVWAPGEGWRGYLQDLAPETPLGVHCSKEELETALFGLDIASYLDITKYQPEIPANMAGKMQGDAPAFAAMTDMENYQKYSDLFIGGELVYMTEKIHGTQMSTIFDGETFKVSSKGVLHKNRATLTDEPSNLYWQAFHQNNLEAGMRILYSALQRPLQLVGEVFRI